MPVSLYFIIVLKGRAADFHIMLWTIPFFFFLEIFSTYIFSKKTLGLASSVNLVENTCLSVPCVE